MLAGSRTPAPFDLILRTGDELFELTRRGHYLLLSDEGLFLGRGHQSQRARFVPWTHVTHLAFGKRALWLGTQHTVRLITRGRRTPLSFAHVAQRIEERIARLPGGVQQLSRLRENDERVRSARTPLVTLAVVALCIGMHLLQISDSFVSEAGSFVRELVGAGELWRIVTAHFLHDVTWTAVTPENALGVPLVLRVPGHITLNCTAALLLGRLVEQPLGRLRTLFVLGISVLGSVSLSAVASSDPMIGASGMVLGLAGAVLALELSVPERLPANWRIPRRLLIAALVLQAWTDWVLPYVAASAHLGGFLGGYLGARLVTRSALQPRPSGGWVRPAAIALGTAAAVAFAAAAPLVLRMGWAFNRHADNILALDDVGAVTLNNLAWRIATETDAFPEAPDRAIALAERAVEVTERANPDYLDTLAEVFFLSGDPSSAILTIDEAIEIAPWDEYFQEQRDRFLGLREAEDRPESPNLPWFLRGPSEAAPWDDGLGVEI